MNCKSFAKTMQKHFQITTINGAKVVEDKRDIEIPQGTAHAVDRVMFPLPVGDIIQTLQSDRERRFTNFLRTLFTSGLAESLQGGLLCYGHLRFKCKFNFYRNQNVHAFCTDGQSFSNFVARRCDENGNGSNLSEGIDNEAFDPGNVVHERNEILSSSR